MDYEINFIDGDEAPPLTHLNISNVFEDSSGKIGHLTGNGDV